MAKQLTGRVTSTKAAKTIVVSVASRKTHPIYKKQYTTNAKFMAHDEKNEAGEGDVVVISETRPLSARKRFKLQRIISKAGAGFQEADATKDVELIVEKPKQAPKETQTEVVQAPKTTPTGRRVKSKKAVEKSQPTEKKTRQSSTKEAADQPEEAS